MKSLTICDKIFKFSNPQYQTLLEAKGLTLQQSKGKKDKKATLKAKAKCSFEDIYINWKPDVLLIITNLIKQHFKKDQPYRVDDDIEQSRQEHFKQVYQDSKFMAMRENYI